MPWSESLCAWLAYSALLSLLILAFGSIVVLLCHQPARRLRIIELSLIGCLLAPWLSMIPGYPQLGIAWRHFAPRQAADSPPPEREPIAEPATGQPAVVLQQSAVVQHEAAVVRARASHVTPQIVVAPVEAPTPAWDVRYLLIALYFLGVAIGVAWWLLGTVALVRILWTARVAPPRCRQLLREIAGRRSDRVRLLTSRRAKQPFASVGLAVQLTPHHGAQCRAVIVLPESLCGDEQAVRWALAHEWTHVERRDFRAWFVAGLARVLFFYQPLVWWLRRQLRLCQDYVADARASREASQPEDYAEFLTVRAAAGVLPPAMTGLGMGFSKSELYRRVVMLVQNRPLESRPPRLWTVSVTCVAMVLIGAVAALSASPQAAAQGQATAKKETTPAAAVGAAPAKATSNPQSKATLLEKLGLALTSSEQENDAELDKIIRDKKYVFLNSFDVPDGVKRYMYRLTYPDGREVGRAFYVPLEKVSSLEEYRQKEKQQRQHRENRIERALAAGRFRLLNLETMQVHICRDVASGKTFMVQRVRRPDQSEIALPRADFGPLPPAVKQTSWQEHLQAIRDGKRQLLNLEATNSYTYEITAEDGTKEILHYGGAEPLEAILKRSADPLSYSEVFRRMAPSTPAKPGTIEEVMGRRPQGNCSLSGKLVSASTGKPIAIARMYLFYFGTHASIFTNTDKEGAFVFKDIPSGPFYLSSIHKAGYQDARYNPEDKPGTLPDFHLKDGERRSGIVLKAEDACRVVGQIRDENGNVPSDTRSISVSAWTKADEGDKYSPNSRGFVKSDGSYVIDGLSNAPVYVMARNWRTEKEGNGYPPIYAPSTFFRGEARLVTFGKSRSVEGLNITLRKTGGLVLEGTVRDEKGVPIPEALVVVHHGDMLFDRVTTYSDAQGHYQLQGLGDGEVLVHVDAIHRGFVRTRIPLALEQNTPKVRRDFILHRGALISGKLVDQEGKEWQVRRSYGEAVITEDPMEAEKGDGGWSGLPNKYGVQGLGESSGVSYSFGEGDYDRSEMVFPTKSTFVFPSLKPGHTFLKFSPQKDGKKVVKILQDGRDVMKSGLDTRPGQEIKDVTIVIGPQ